MGEQKQRFRDDRDLECGDVPAFQDLPRPTDPSEILLGMGAVEDRDCLDLGVRVRRQEPGLDAADVVAHDVDRAVLAGLAQAEDLQVV